MPILRRHVWKRLKSQIVIEERVSAARQKTKGAGKIDPEIRGMLKRARVALHSGDIDPGWKCLHAARRFGLLTLEGQHDELKAEATSMRSEADKLEGWRKNAFTALLDEGAPPTTAHLFKAAEIRDEHYDNQAYKDSLRRTAILGLGLFLFLVLFAVISLGQQGHLPKIVGDEATGVDSFMTLISIVVMGLLGATVSAITRATQPQGPTRIPEMVASFRVTALRLMMGAASAVAVFFVVRSTFYDSVFQLPEPDGYGLLVIAFVAGFTERLVLRVVELIAGKSSG